MSASEPLISDRSSGEERKHFLNEVCRDWKFHRDDVLKEVFEMCDKDGDEKLAGLKILFDNLIGLSLLMAPLRNFDMEIGVCELSH